MRSGLLSAQRLRSCVVGVVVLSADPCPSLPVPWGYKACNKPFLAATSRILLRARTPARLVGEEGEWAGMGPVLLRAARGAGHRSDALGSCA